MAVRARRVSSTWQLTDSNCERVEIKVASPNMAKECCVCQEERAKYKCPTCKRPYCSIDCCRMHKNVGCSPVEPEPNSNSGKTYDDAKRKYNFPTEDTIRVEKLQELCRSAKLKECLQNSDVRRIMEGILSDSDPTRAIAKAMKEPVFLEMANACLKIVEPPNEEDLTRRRFVSQGITPSSVSERFYFVENVDF